MQLDADNIGLLTKARCSAGTSCPYGDLRSITSICFKDNMLMTEVYGHASSLELPETAQVRL